MLEESLISLAILKVNWDERGHDYVQNFIPFLGEALRRSSSDHASVSELQAIFRRDFGLVIPQGAINTMLRRAERHSYVHRAGGAFIRNLAAIPETFGTERASVARQQKALIDKLVVYCHERHNVVWTVEQAEDALLAHMQKSCIPILAAAVDGCPVPLPADKVPHSEFLVSSFIVHLEKGDPGGFSFLETVMKGHMLATALFLPDIAKVKQKFDDLEVYIDTRILLRALGLEGEELKAGCVELLTLLYRMNVTLACFDITLDEVRGILEAAQHALKDTRHQSRPGLFSVYEHLLSSGARASDVELMIANLEKSLRRNHIFVKPRPAHETELGLNERKLEEIVQEELPDQRIEARRHDIDCLTSIHRLRRGRVYSDIERCKYLFVTTNQSLARASTRFFIEEYERVTAPLCVNDHTLTTLAWVKNPTYAANFSRRRLIADSYAALHGSGDLWKKYSDEVARLRDGGDISAEDYHLLRFSTVARNALLDATLGSSDAFTEGTVPQILERARAAARKEVEEDLKVEVARRTAAESELEGLRREKVRQTEWIDSVSAMIGGWVGRCVYIGLAIVFAIGFYVTLPSVLPRLPESWRIVSWVALAVFAVLAVWSAVEGGSIRAISRSIEVMARERCTRILTKALTR